MAKINSADAKKRAEEARKAKEAKRAADAEKRNPYKKKAAEKKAAQQKNEQEEINAAKKIYDAAKKEAGGELSPVQAAGVVNNAPQKLRNHIRKFFRPERAKGIASTPRGANQGGHGEDEATLFGIGAGTWGFSSSLGMFGSGKGFAKFSSKLNLFGNNAGNPSFGSKFGSSIFG